MFGNVSFVASADLGGLGPRDGSPVVYYCNPLWNLIRLLPWLIPLLLLRDRRNRTLHAAAVFIPGLGLMMCTELLGFSVVRFTQGGIGTDIGDGSVALAAGLTAVWLLSGAPKPSHGSVLLRSVMPMIQTAALGLISSMGGSGDEPYLLLTMFGTALPAAIAIAFALLLTRRKRSLARFSLGLFIGLILIGLFLGLLIASIVALQGQTPFPIMSVVLIAIGGSAISCIPVGMFVLFTRFSPEYRRRWENDLLQ